MPRYSSTLDAEAIVATPDNALDRGHPQLASPSTGQRSNGFGSQVATTTAVVPIRVEELSGPEDSEVQTGPTRP
jgi:hypothetical protein